ncbi:hypothetical protein [Paraburkholderia tropica]|uniref:Uncharacterized protein n=1 Tax=Paraburkholderia tropica TaxID=92647 RepID=A0AAQ1GJE6_9BURK|nr:hypothetical protein [Paraburkholderia tropica]SEK02438.1 hypothetical protein SAMN05216550_113173 [Paraburkholderia tropica]
MNTLKAIVKAFPVMLRLRLDGEAKDWKTAWEMALIYLFLKNQNQQTH